MSKLISISAIYTIWLREMKRFIRAKSRIVGSLGMPFFFLAIIGSGFSRMQMMGIPAGIDYMNFLAPGIIGMVLLFASMAMGISVIWDRQFGFLKEIMVTPVSRTSIVLGRIAGGVTTALIQSFLILILATLMGGIKGITILGFMLSVVFMILISASFVGLGLAFASKMEDMHGFQLVMNFVIMPLFFLSGALFPLDKMPAWIQYLAYIDPLTYGVDGLRNCLIGISEFSLLADFGVLSAFCVAMVVLGTYLFGKTEVD